MGLWFARKRRKARTIIEDLEVLQNNGRRSSRRLNHTTPALLNRDDDFIQRVLRDMYGSDVNRIVVDSNTGFEAGKAVLDKLGGVKHRRDC